MPDSSSDVIEWPETLPTPLIGRVHMFEPRPDITVMESNRRRSRRVHQETLELMDVQWNFTADEYDAFRTFFISELEQGTLIFRLVTLEPHDTSPFSLYEVTRDVAFLDCSYTFAESDNLFSVAAVLEVDAQAYETVNNPNVPQEQDMDPPPDIDYPSPCKEEIRFELPEINNVINVVIEHAEGPDGPWLFWGETRQLEDTVVIGNYFAGRWVKIKVEVEGGGFYTHVFEPDPPSVLPPLVTLLTHPRDDVYPTNHVATALSAYALPYGGGYSGVTGDNNIAAVYTGNLTDPETGVEMYRINLFSSAMVEVGPRYQQPFSDHATGVTGWNGKTVRVAVTSTEPGATVKFTTDGTDPTLSNGHDSGYSWSPQDHDDPLCPYIIARCFKDGCPSPPVYIPIDLLDQQQAFTTAWGQGGDGSASCQCKVWTQAVDPEDPEACLPPEHQTGFTGGSLGWCSNDTASPCSVDGAALQASAISNACNAGTTGLGGAKIMRRLVVTQALGFSTAHPSFNYQGPYPGDCPASFWGGGNWITSYFALMLTHFTWTWDTRLDDYTEDAFYLLTAGVEINSAATVDFPPSGTILETIEGMGATGSSTNDYSDKLLLTVLASGATSCPSDGERADLETADILFTCARASAL